MHFRTRLFLTFLLIIVLSQLPIGIAFIIEPYFAPSSSHTSLQTVYPNLFSVLLDSLAALSNRYRWLKKELILSSLLTTACLILFALWISKRLSSPLNKLSHTASQISDGYRFTSSSQVQRHPETRLISKTITALQADIEKRDKTLLLQTRSDPLTQLPNQVAAFDSLEDLVAQQTPFTIMRLALHELRAINSTFGYSVGDQVLIAIADRLRDFSSPQHHPYRLTNNEFLIINEGDPSNSAWLELLIQHLSNTIAVNHLSTVKPICSIGSVSFPSDGNSVQQLFRRADIALQQAQDKAVRYEFYTEELDKLQLRKRTLINDLPNAVTHDELWIDYQPKAALESQKAEHFEALIRWHHPTLGLIRPDEFIELAERSGNISLLSQWMLVHVCQQLHIWNQSGQRLSVAINLSASDITNAQLPQQLEQLLETYDLDPDQLAIEVTETTAMQDMSQAVNILKEISALGIVLAIDDFGTGYSSLAQLKRLPFNELKIDKSFILRLNTDEDDRLIVRSTIELGHRLGLKVIAEGVENHETADLLSKMGCDYLQGYWISKPMPSHQVLDWLKHFKGLSPNQ